MEKAYYDALAQESCAFVNVYYLHVHKVHRASLKMGAIRPGLGPELERLARLRAAAKSKGLTAIMRRTESRWHHDDGLADRICDTDDARASTYFEAVNDTLEQELRRF